MKTVIVYYSYGGITKKYSNALAKETQADVYEVDTLKKRSFIGNLFLECPKALTQKPTTIKDVNLDWSSYEKVVLAFPMWAGFPAPTFNNIVNILPSGKEVEIIIISGSGITKPENKEKIIALVNKTGSNVVNYKDVLNTNVK